MARVIREPSELLRRTVGPSAPVFDPAVIERPQAEIVGEPDALPLLAFVLQRLMREHSTTGTVGKAELDRTGGVTAAIESEAEAALADAGIAADRGLRRKVLRRLFIPRLARIDHESKAPQRRVAGMNELPARLLGLVHALTQRRLLVRKLAALGENEGVPGTATLEVAHEALLRRWPTLTDLLAEDRDALLLLDGLLNAASDWDRAEPHRKPDFLLHRGTRLLDWEVEIIPAAAYLAGCQAREDAERKEQRAKSKEQRAKSGRRRSRTKRPDLPRLRRRRTSGRGQSKSARWQSSGRRRRKGRGQGLGALLPGSRRAGRLRRLRLCGSRSWVGRN
jgi:hypothetical protein